MCFAPQRRALFRHLNFEKWSAPGVLCTFWLRNVLRTTKACTFWHRNFQTWPEHGVFCAFWLRNCFAPQRRAIFHLSSGQLAPHPPLWRAYFSTLRSHKSLEKRNVSRLSYPFAHLHLLSSSLLFSSLTLPTSAFHLSILSEVWLLNFLRLRYIKQH